MATTQATPTTTTHTGHHTPLEFLTAVARHPGTTQHVTLQVCEYGRLKRACVIPAGNCSAILFTSYANHEPLTHAGFICYNLAPLLGHMDAANKPCTVGNIVRHMHARDVLGGPMGTARITSIRYAGLYAWVLPYEHILLPEVVLDEIAFLTKTVNM